MSFYTSLSGLRCAQTDLDVISHNLANAETDGFKRSGVVFADVVAASANSIATGSNGVGATVSSVKQDFGIGSFQQTGNALDLAIGGDGFFTTVSPKNGQTLFTRNGGFQMDASGYITDVAGNRLQMIAAGAPAGTPPVAAQVPQVNAAASSFARVSVDSNGVITGAYLDGTTTTVGTVALASFVTPPGLKAVGASNWAVTGLSGAPTYGTPNLGVYGALQTGTLERSNVDVSTELVDLITAQRYFQANAKAIDTATQVSQTIINLRN